MWTNLANLTTCCPLREKLKNSKKYIWHLEILEHYSQSSFRDNLIGLGSIGTTSSDRQSRKIDVQHERTSIAELDMAPPTSIVFPTPKIQKSLPYSLKRPRRWAGRHWNCTTIDTIARGSTWKSVERATQCILHGAGPAPTTLHQALPRATESNREIRHRDTCCCNLSILKWNIALFMEVHCYS